MFEPSLQSPGYGDAMQAKRAMVVDNHPVMRRFMSDFLTEKGYEVVTAPDGLSALEALEDCSPDIVFVDLVMPHIGGEKLCRVIRRRKSLEQCFVVVVSAIVSEKDFCPADLEADVILAKGPLDKLSANVDFIVNQVSSGRRAELRGRVIGRDHLAERQISKELIEISGNYDLALEHMSEGLLETQGSKVVYLNAAALAMIGIREEDLLAGNFVDLFREGDQAMVVKRMFESLDVRRPVLLDPLVMPGGRLVSIRILPVRKANREDTTLVIMRDITVEKLAEEKLLKSQEQYKREKNFLENIFESSADAIAILDKSGRFIRWNDQASRLLGYSFTEMRAKRTFEICANREAMKLLVADIRRSEFVRDREVDLKRKDGTIMPGALSMSILRDGSREKIGTLAIIRDLSHWKQTEEKLRFLSFHDPLTGLYNRAYFEEEMKRLTAARHLPMGIIVCDINLLKFINDTFGHQKGDALIRAAADILRRSFRSSDLIARIGGDEFAVLLPESNREVVEERVHRIVEEIGNYNKEASAQSLSLAIGCAVSEHAPLDMQMLFKEADDNMYREKFREEQTGRSRIIQYLFRVLGKKDFVAEGHVERLEDYAVKMAEETGLSGEQFGRLRLLARFHDLGKVAIRNDILFKPDTLSREEFREVKQHCEIGRRIALSSAELAPVAELILKHHEWWNGQGYPLGLKGTEIPIECRIISIADAYDIMTKKYYKEAKTPEDAARELRRGAGTQFDPDLVETFLRIVDPG